MDKFNVIAEEAQKWINSNDIHISLYQNWEQYFDYMDIDEDEKEEHIAFLKDYTTQDKPFYMIYENGISLFESTVLRAEDVETHEDLLSCIAEDYLWDRKLVRQELIYVNEDNLERFERVYHEHFDGKPFHRSPYSASCYNAKQIGWRLKPNGSVRLSDHWNFVTEAEEVEAVENEFGEIEYVEVVHCKSNTASDVTAICYYNQSTGRYESLFEDLGDGIKVPIKIKEDGIEIYR